MQIAEGMQGYGAGVTLRTYGVLRLTLETDVTPEIVETLKGMLNQMEINYKIFTDTPIDVWAAAREQRAKMNELKQVNRERKKAQREAVTAEREARKQHRVRTITPEEQAILDDGKVIVKLAVDCVVQPTVYESVAKHLGGQVMSLIEAKYTDVPLVAIIAVPPSDLLEEMLSEPFEVNTGIMYATRVLPRI